jgi:nucleotide-binding universal stress UspA family protein
MSKHFMGPGNKIIVAANFDGAFERLTKDAADIAARTGMALRFVHAVDPVSGHTSRAVMRRIADLEPVFEAVDESRQIKAEQRLTDALGDRINPDSVAVLSGDPVNAIIAEATVNRAPLIMVAANGSHYRFVPKGMSTALRLMSESEIPVLISPGGSREHPAPAHDLGKKRLRMLIADDLSDEGQDVVFSAIDIARALGDTDVLHVHACALSDERIKSWIDDLSPGMRDQKVAEEISVALRHNQDEALKLRAPERIPLLEARGGSYRHEVVWGDPVEQISRAADAFEADIVVFGRHRALHRKSFTVGRIPLYAMLEQKRLVMIVPPRYHG